MHTDLQKIAIDRNLIVLIHYRFKDLTGFAFTQGFYSQHYSQYQLELGNLPATATH